MTSARQQRHLNRLAERNIRQTNVYVHDDCRPALDQLRPYLNEPSSAEALNQLVSQVNSEQPVNVSQVRQLSPFRYPGGKTWLVPVTRKWLTNMENRPKVLLEPFAGGAMVGLSAAAENLVELVELVELDDDVSAVWELIFNGTDRQVTMLNNKILKFKVNIDNVRHTIDSPAKSLTARAFRTIVKNRCQRGGIMAPGAGLVKTGENNRGLASRWYPETIVKRIQAIRTFKERVRFTQGDAFEAIERHPESCLFIDPPYTAAGKRAGSRLYTHNEIDHGRLFDLVQDSRGPALLTYDDSPEVREMSAKHDFIVGDIAMKNSHHVVMRELTIFKN